MSDVRRTRLMGSLAALALLTGCAGGMEPPPASIDGAAASPYYRIGPGDALRVVVWRNQELSSEVRVRPDGRITVPLIEDMVAADKTPTVLARDIEEALGAYVQEPRVSVVVSDFVGPFSQQVRVVGAAANPQAIPYRAHMSLLDAMIAVGGLSEFAAGDEAVLVRTEGDGQSKYRVRLDRLVRDGDIDANVALLPGDIVIIPQSFF